MYNSQKVLHSGSYYSSFGEGYKTWNVVIGSLKIIGETVKFLSEEIKRNYPGISLKKYFWKKREANS